MEQARKKRKSNRRMPQIGERFGSRTITGLAGIRYGHKLFVVCRCDCGREAEVSYSFLLIGMSTVCPFCRPKRIKHGDCNHRTRSPEYSVWTDMKHRCQNSNHRQYHHYGGRGITVCEQWQSYENFLRDMGRRPTPKHTLDRVDNGLGYSPDNCRWALMIVQLNNKRDNRYVTYNNRTLTVSEWSREIGIHKATLQRRLVTGWDVADALTFPAVRGSSYRHRKAASEKSG